MLILNIFVYFHYLFFLLFLVFYPIILNVSHFVWLLLFLFDGGEAEPAELFAQSVVFAVCVGTEVGFIEAEFSVSVKKRIQPPSGSPSSQKAKGVTSLAKRVGKGSVGNPKLLRNAV